MAPKVAAYAKGESKFVKWRKCKFGGWPGARRARGKCCFGKCKFKCSKVYAVCAAEAQASCSADATCRAVAVKKTAGRYNGGHYYLKYTDSICVAKNTYANKHWDMYLPTQAKAKCWVRMPTGCARGLSETSTPLLWFVDPHSPDSAKCTSRLNAFNGHCKRSDATSQWGSQPQAPPSTTAPAAPATTPAPPPSSNAAGLDALKNLTKRVNGLESKIDVVIKAVR